MSYEKDFLEKIYKDLLETRMLEEKLVEIYAEGKVPGHIHSGVGQEASYVGVLATRKPGDYFKIGHRVIAATCVLGNPLDTFFGEILAKKTGNAGGRESNLRRYIIENDMLEAIVAMPEKDFYNTGIGTYIWIVTNRKEKRRRGKVQLIDATAISTPLKKNLGEKNCETSEADCDRIVKLLMDFKETPESKILKNEEFGYWEVPVMRPKRDADGKLVLKKGKPVIAKARNEVEQIPLTYPGGIEAFYEKEVKPYDAEATFGEPAIGYEISFTKHFYKPVELRSLDAIAAEIAALEKANDGLLKEILG